MMKFKPGFVFIVPLIIALLIVGGGLYGVYTIFSDKSPKATSSASPSPSSVHNPFPQSTPAPVSSLPPEQPKTPQDQGGPIKQPSNITGKWLGRYTVSNPQACNGESGGWTANLVDNNGKLSGSFESDGGGGNISGSYAGSQVNWSVGGGGGGISFTGSISGNTVSGSFQGQVCDPKEAPQATSGGFFGGKQ